MKTISKRFAQLLFMTALAGIIAAGCSKEKRVEHRLEKVKNWNIDKIDYQKVQTGTGVTAKVGTETNAGTMIFNKDGSGSYDYMLDGQKRTGTFTWTNSVNNVTFNYVATSATIVQAVSYTILDDSSKSMTLQGSEVIIDATGNQLVLNATFYLSK